MIVRIRYLSVAATLAICSSAIAQKTVERQEYWIDGDVAGSTTIAAGAQIDLTGQNVGPHTLTVRICDSEGVWSSPVTRYFVKASISGPSATSIAQCEYWFDGKADERQTISDGAFIPMDGLLVGPHTITVRTKDDLDVWSAPVTRYFVKGSTPSAPATSIAQCEYWFDGNTAERKKVEDCGELVLENLDPGIHTITVRSKDNLDVWSSPVTRYFVITAQKAPAEITQCLYWFDSDAEHTYTAPLSGSEGMAEISVFGMLAVGEHTITWAVVDSEGRMSNTMTETFYIIVDGIETIGNGQLRIDDESWYTLSGVKLNAKPTETGIYIWKGKKVILK